MSIEQQTVGETEIKVTRETTIRLQEILASTGKATTLEKEATRLLIFGRRKGNRKRMNLTTSLWEPFSVENFKKRTMKKISKNGYEEEVRHCTSHIRINT